MRTEPMPELGKDVYAMVPETPIEAVESLQEFLQADMWYAIHAEWKDDEAKMHQYLWRHFTLLKNALKIIENPESHDLECIYCGSKNMNKKHIDECLNKSISDTDGKD